MCRGRKRRKQIENEQITKHSSGKEKWRVVNDRRVIEQEKEKEEKLTEFRSWL